jgi:hypothetical protein
LTVVCPPVEAADAAVLCTSIDCPVIEAMVPKAPGGVAGRADGAELEEVDLLALAAEDPPPQAARASAALPRTASTEILLTLAPWLAGRVGPDVENGE